MKRKIALCLVVALCCGLLAACGGPNTDPDAAKAALEKNGYTALKIEYGFNLQSALLLGLTTAGVDDIDIVVNGTKDSETVTIIYFDSAEDAKEEMDDVQDYIEKISDGNWICKQSGNMIYYGTEAAIKAAK